MIGLPLCLNISWYTKSVIHKFCFVAVLSSLWIYVIILETCFEAAWLEQGQYHDLSIPLYIQWEIINDFKLLNSLQWHHNDTSILIVSSAICSGIDQRKHQSSTLLVFVRGIHQWIPLTKVQ